MAVIVLLLRGIATVAWADNQASSTRWPSTSGAVFALQNLHFSAPRITLDENGRELLTFGCITRGRALIGCRHDLVCDGGSFVAEDAGHWVGRQVADAGAFTVALSVTPTHTRATKPGVVIAYGNGTGQDFALLQDGDNLTMQWGNAETIHLFTVHGNEPMHVLIACEQNHWTAYRDGKAVRSARPPVKAADWKSRKLVFGDDWAAERPWYGRIEMIAVFARSLTADEAVNEAMASAAIQAKRQPMRRIRFRGTLLRQAKTADVEAIRPYTRSMTAAEYKVDEVLEGEWKEPNITVLHWMILDRTRLPLADRAPGATVELIVEPLEQHPQLESARRDENIAGEIPLDMFYCESEKLP